MSSVVPSPNTSKRDALVVGRFYWVRPAFDVDFTPPGFEGQEWSDAQYEASWTHWSHQDQPAIFLGWTSGGQERWAYLGVEFDERDPDFNPWPAIWIGPEIRSMASKSGDGSTPQNPPPNRGEGEWFDIESAPRGRIVLLARYRDFGEPTDCWLIETGHVASDERILVEGFSRFFFGGRQLKNYEFLPTKWRPLPPPPLAAKEPDRG